MWNKALFFSIVLSLVSLSFVPYAHATPDSDPVNDSPAVISQEGEPYQNETIDTYARRKLFDANAMSTANGSGIELLFTQTVTRKTTAYVLIDAKYGKDVRVGDTVKGWKVARIDADGITLQRGSQREKLLLESDATLIRASSGNGRQPR